MGVVHLVDHGRGVAPRVLRIRQPSHDERSPRERSAWLSPRDAADLIRAAVEVERITFAVANGIAANRCRRADLDETVGLLGYRPADDAWAT